MYGNCGVGELWCMGMWCMGGDCGVWEYIRLMEVESVVCSVTLTDLLAQLSDSS